ncbi:MAG: hypothetical protein IIY55_06690, partial [Blautia sp.]|nr:hypothetical protein [Blautia sp.]
DMMEYQNHICQNNPDVVMASFAFSTMLERGLMKDEEHYYQQAYNECGDDVGVNMASYVNTGKEPMLYDPQFDELYYSKAG